MGNTINITDSSWIDPTASIGAGYDSFYEYLFKAYTLFGDAEYLQMFKQVYQGISTHIRDKNGFIYKPTHINGGMTGTYIVGKNRSSVDAIGGT